MEKIQCHYTYSEESINDFFGKIYKENISRQFTLSGLLFLLSIGVFGASFLVFSIPSNNSFVVTFGAILFFGGILGGIFSLFYFIKSFLFDKVYLKKGFNKYVQNIHLTTYDLSFDENDIEIKKGDNQYSFKWIDFDFLFSNNESILLLIKGKPIIFIPSKGIDKLYFDQFLNIAKTKVVNQRNTIGGGFN